MQNLSIARRYARALIDVAAETGSLDPVANQLDTLSTLMSDSADLRDVLLNPAYSREQRGAVLGGILKSIPKLEPSVNSLVQLLLDRQRFAAVPDIARQFREMADSRAGRVRGKVTSAAPLSADALRGVEQALEKLVQRDVVLEAAVDPALLGGVSAQVGSILFDGSLRTQLEDLRRSLKAR